MELTNLRTMSIPATAATYYPTGIAGLGGAIAAANTRTTTAGNSMFIRSGALVQEALTFLYGINIVTGAAASTIAVQTHGGTLLLDLISGVVERDIQYYGLPILGGWRIVTTATPIVHVIYSFKGLGGAA